ncbi:MAG: EscF/YscF/HrpA family type III secretion system needle major subunit [Pseudomonadota bacterium]
MAQTANFANIATGVRSEPSFNTPAVNFDRDGFDLIFRQAQLQSQMAAIEESIREIEQNTNLSDTEKMFSMQMAMNSWSAITNLRSNMLKNVSDSLKTIARNVA